MNNKKHVQHTFLYRLHFLSMWLHFRLGNRGYIFLRCGYISGWVSVGYIFRRGYIFGYEVPQKCSHQQNRLHFLVRFFGDIFWRGYISGCNRPSATLISFVSRLTSGLSPRSRAALCSSIMSMVGSEIHGFFGMAFAENRIGRLIYGTLEGFPIIIDILIARVKIFKESIAVMNFNSIFRSDGLVIN